VEAGEADLYDVRTACLNHLGVERYMEIRTNFIASDLFKFGEDTGRGYNSRAFTGYLVEIVMREILDVV